MKQKLLGGLACCLTIAAASIFVVGAPVDAYAFECSCFSGGLPTSHGGCEQNACQEPEFQQCNAGQWSGCTTDCQDLPPCIDG